MALDQRQCAHHRRRNRSLEKRCARGAHTSAPPPTNHEHGRSRHCHSAPSRSSPLAYAIEPTPVAARSDRRTTTCLKSSRAHRGRDRAVRSRRTFCPRRSSPLAALCPMATLHRVFPARTQLRPTVRLHQTSCRDCSEMKRSLCDTRARIPRKSTSSRTVVCHGVAANKLLPFSDTLSAFA
jgi:hypothetical protein